MNPLFFRLRLIDGIILNISFSFIALRDKYEQYRGHEHQSGKEPELVGAFQTGTLFVNHNDLIHPRGQQVPDGNSQPEQGHDERFH